MPKIPFWIFIVIGVLYFTAIRVDTMDVDASQYAEMSREMMHSQNWLELHDRGLQYLDKPPLLFWVSAASMKVFGVNNFGYKFPSILFALWAIYATYRLAKLLYEEQTARLAALVLATCQGLFLMTNDIRCDTILMSWVVTAIWQIKEWDVTRRYKHLWLGFAAVGMGMMTKGPIALMVPVFSFASDWVLKREWRKFFNPAYLLGVVIILLILLPMSIGLYQQFDMHPERSVNGGTHVSGLRFFYWSQSFGRITGESPWKNGAGFDFLLTNMLWSFLPWIFVFVPALVVNVIRVVRQKFRLLPNQEFVSTGGFLLAYMALGSSAYQLPHYIFVVFPLAAIVTAAGISGFLQRSENARLYKVLRGVLYFICGALFVAVPVLITYVFPSGVLAAALYVVLLAGWIYVAANKRYKARIVLLPALAMIIANVFVTNYLYHSLLQYQAGSQVGRFIHNTAIPEKGIVMYRMDDPVNAINFYAGRDVTCLDTLVTPNVTEYVLTMDKGLAVLKQRGYMFDILKQGPQFKVSQLTLPFLMPATRHTELNTYYLLKMK